jgi:hypothetical protein
MREIKFRAWNATNETMCYLDPLYWPLIAINSSENWFVMQYTGLKDKNGKEIFEGDVVEGFGGDRWMVKWGTGAWEPFDGNMNADKSYRYEVIGNIHEHPELRTT